MNPRELKDLKRRLRRLWLLSPERLWMLSIRLRAGGHWILAFWLKQLNSLIYHNSLAPGATVADDISLGHNSLGIVVSSEVEIGREVLIWQNVTLSAGRRDRTAEQAAPLNGDGPAARPTSRIVIGDRVKIGANAVVIAPRGRVLTVGSGARIGAGTVVTEDVPEGARVVGAPVRVLPPRDPIHSDPGEVEHGSE